MHAWPRHAKSGTTEGWQDLPVASGVGGSARMAAVGGSAQDQHGGLLVKQVATVIASPGRTVAPD